MSFVNRHTLSLVASAALLAACSSVKQQVSLDVEAANRDMAAHASRVREAVMDSERQRIAAQDVARPYIVGRAIPMAREVTFPEPLKKNVQVTALFARDGVDLATAARQLSEAAGVPISVTADALMPAASFAPRLSGSVQSPSAAGRVLLSGLAQHTPLWTVLDEVARQAQVSWRVAGAGVELYRTETRVFKIAALAQLASATASLGRNAGQQAAFEAQSKTGFELTKQDQTAGVRSTVEAMLSVAGRLVLAPESQTLIVTDTPAVLDRVSEYIEQTNKALSRRVRVMVEAIEVIAKDGTELGIDWNLFYSALSGNTTGNAVTPAGLGSAQAGSLRIGVGGTGRWANSNVVIKALSEVGTVVSRRTFPFLTTSGRPITQALRSTFNYVDSVQATNTSGLTTSQPAPTVTQKEETVGTFVTLVPVAKDNGQIFLSLSFDVTSAEPLVPFSVGSGNAMVTVQQKTINGTGLVQEIPMRSGQTVVVGGVESLIGQNIERRLAPGAPLLAGGSDKSSINRSHMVLLVTAVTEEGY